VKCTKASGDYGVDVLASKGRNRYAIQCKLYSNPVGLGAVQEVAAGMKHYGCNVGMVITNNTFTSQAIRLAHENGIVLKPHVKPGSVPPRRIAKIPLIAIALCLIALVLDLTTHDERILQYYATILVLIGILYVPIRFIVWLVRRCRK
jgi:hypothetical protein